MRDSNPNFRDSNLWPSVSLFSSPGIRIAWMEIWIYLFEQTLLESGFESSLYGFKLLSLNSSAYILESGFECSFEWFKSHSSIWTLWKWDSNPPLRDSNHLHQVELSKIRIRILLWGIWITFVKFVFCANEGFKSITRRFKSFSLTFNL